jgi:hypothetical protein
LDGGVGDFCDGEQLRFYFHFHKGAANLRSCGRQSPGNGQYCGWQFGRMTYKGRYSEASLEELDIVSLATCRLLVLVTGYAHQAARQYHRALIDIS